MAHAPPCAASHPAEDDRMHILWNCLRPNGKLALLALLPAAISQVLALVAPIIFGMLIDGNAITVPQAPD